MTPKPNVSVFIFRRDFRLYDNSALIAAAKLGPVLPIFIFNPAQVSRTLAPLYNGKLIRFMLESLESLKNEIEAHSGKLYFFENTRDVDVLSSILAKVKFSSVYFNMDLTPFAVKRDQEISDWCNANGINVQMSQDYTLHDMDAIRNKTGGVYHVFTPFKNTCLTFNVAKPMEFSGSFFVYSEISLGDISDSKVDEYADEHDVKHVSLYGGRSVALKIIDRIRKGEFKRYEDERNDAHAQKTTMLASYLKFGCISVREAYHAIKDACGKESALLSELYWREFYHQLTFHRPEILSRQISKVQNSAMKERMRSIKWKSSKDYPEHWKAWCEGKTGVPIVDAGMRQMLATGYMHNRPRMIVSMYLTKNLHIDWREGELFFAKHLIDYDPSSNNGGWQWSASTGVDTQPYRIFNAWTQATRYDAQCEYVKEWVPELKQVPVADILKWEKESVRSKWIKKGVYVSPIVDHSETAALGKTMLKGEPVPW